MGSVPTTTSTVRHRPRTSRTVGLDAAESSTSITETLTSAPARPASAARRSARSNTWSLPVPRSRRCGTQRRTACDPSTSAPSSAQPGDADTERTVDQRRDVAALDRRAQYAVANTIFEHAAPSAVVVLERVDQRSEPVPIGDGVVVEQRHVVDVVEVADAEVAAAREPDVAVVLEHLHRGLRRSTGGATPSIDALSTITTSSASAGQSTGAARRGSAASCRRRRSSARRREPWAWAASSTSRVVGNRSTVDPDVHREVERAEAT